MAYNPITAFKTVGKVIKQELLNLIDNNFQDHENRLNQLETTGGSVFIFNGDIDFRNYNSTYSDIFYFKARQDFSVNDFRAQLFTRQGITSGTLSLDLQKASNTNSANFNSILDTVLSFNFAVDADYTERVADLSALNGVLTGDVLRIVVISKPATFSGKILVNIGAE